VNTGITSLDACVQEVIEGIMNHGIFALPFDQMPESESTKYEQGNGV